MKFTVPLLITLILIAFTLQAKAEDCCTLEKYIRIHPEERIKTNAFAKHVRKNDVPKLKENLHLKIAIVYLEDQISEYWQRNFDSLQRRLEQYGTTPTFYKFFIKPKASLNKQNNIFRQALETNPDYLILTLDALRHKRMVEPILIRNKPRIILQDITTPLTEWADRQPMMYIGFDHAGGAKMLASYFATATGGTGKYAVLLPDPGSLSDERGNTFISFMDKNTSMELVSLFRTGRDKEKARLATINIVKKNPEIKFIYACSTDIALGAVEGLRETDLLGKIMVNGWGGGTPEVEAIKKGDMDVTVMKINDDSGIATADAIVLDMQGQSSKLPLVFSGRFEIVERGIKPEDLERLLNESFRFSGIKR